METTSYNQTVLIADLLAFSKRRHAKFWAAAEFNRFGINILFMFLAFCSGAFAAAFSLNMGDLQFALIICVNMLTLSFVLGLVPMKPLMFVGSIAIIINAITIACGLLG